MEQVTKEKFIRAIVGDPPQVVDHQENVELEQRVVAEKAALKALKAEVAELTVNLAQKGREICRRYELVQGQTVQLQELPGRIEELQRSVASLREAQQGDNDPNMHLPLDKTLSLLRERQAENAELDRQLEQLQSSIPRKARELDRLNAEIQPLEVKQLASITAADEAKRRKEAAPGGVEDDLKERGRWWRGVENGLNTMLVEP